MQEAKISMINKLAIKDQHKLAVIIKFSVISIAVAALYFQDLTMVFIVPWPTNQLTHTSHPISLWLFNL